jgi:hypothetical protein
MSESDSASESPETDSSVSPIAPAERSPILTPPSHETGFIHGISFRIAIAVIWILSISIGLPNSTIVHGFTTFILSAFTCIGLFGIFAIITIPIAYAFDPEYVVRFKFGSLGPIIAIRIANGLDMLDCLVYRAVRYTTKKQSTQ